MAKEPTSGGVSEIFLMGFIGSIFHASGRLALQKSRGYGLFSSATSGLFHSFYHFLHCTNQTNEFLASSFASYSQVWPSQLLKMVLNNYKINSKAEHVGHRLNIGHPWFLVKFFGHEF